MAAELPEQPEKTVTLDDAGLPEDAEAVLEETGMTEGHQWGAGPHYHTGGSGNGAAGILPGQGNGIRGGFHLHLGTVHYLSPGGHAGQPICRCAVPMRG